MADGVGKGVQPYVIGHFEPLSLNKFFDPSTPSMRKGRDGENVLNGDVKEALKSSFFVVQKAAAPKSGVEFRQGSIGTIRSSLATSYDA